MCNKCKKYRELNNVNTILGEFKPSEVFAYLYDNSISISSIGLREGLPICAMNMYDFDKYIRNSKSHISISTHKPVAPGKAPVFDGVAFYDNHFIANIITSDDGSFTFIIFTLTGKGMDHQNAVSRFVFRMEI
jgi:hypothetical protein